MRMTHARSQSVAKALSWRVVASLTTIGLVYAVTGQAQLAIAVGGIETVAKLVLYYFHERLWARSSWGTHAASD